ncbi:MAG TPA: hypothetical protein VHM29_06560, partial [Acidimicrobiia bacterium]|nr:hypothetical protein [Acidimicrobiia bacterium]
MASRRGLALIVALVLALAACTESASPPQPTAPSDAFAPTPTIGAPTTTRPAPTTTLDVERVVIQRVDPISLDPLSAFEPIPMGDWLWEPKTSPDGRFLAAAVGDDSAENQLRMVDLHSWLPAMSWATFPDLIVQVDDEGTVYFITYYETPQLHFSVLDGSGSTVIADLPEGLSVWGAEMIGEQIVLFGTKIPPAGGVERALVVTVDVVSREVTEIDLPEVHVGPVEPVSQGPWASYLYNSPSFTVDRAGQRVLVAHANESFITEVDLSTGLAIQHDLADASATPETGTRRWGAVSPDGRFLYVASRDVELIEDDDNWSVNTIPAGVAAIDTSSWQVVARTDQPISDIYISPAGDRLVASGYTTEESDSVYVSESTG